MLNSCLGEAKINRLCAPIPKVLHRAGRSAEEIPLAGLELSEYFDVAENQPDRYMNYDGHEEYVEIK